MTRLKTKSETIDIIKSKVENYLANPPQTKHQLELKIHKYEEIIVEVKKQNSLLHSQIKNVKEATLKMNLDFDEK